MAVKKKWLVVGFSLILATLGLAVAVVTVTRSKSSQNLTNLAAGGGVDVLNYFVSKHAIGVGSAPQASSFTQVVSGNTSYYVKSRPGNQFEYHTWDNNYIYLKQDTSTGNVTLPDGVKASSYRLDPGVWMPRFMQIGQPYPMQTTINWYNDSCQLVDSSPFYKYTMTLEKEIPNYPAGGNLGNQDVIVLKYDYISVYEKFFYSKEWGWIHWEEWNPKTNTMDHSASMNNTDAPLTLPIPKCGSPTPPYSLHKECRNNACVTVVGSGKDNCPNNCKDVASTPTHLVCGTNKTCISVAGSGSNTDGCQAEGASCGATTTTTKDEADSCWGGKGTNGKCYDCNGDGTVNILDFACFSNLYGKDI